MKRHVKIIIFAVAVVVAAAGYAYYASMPVDIETVRVEPVNVREYFIEEGNVAAGTAVDVYAATSGKIARFGPDAAEDAPISAGDVICVLDPSDYENAIARSRSAIEGYRAQKADLDEKRLARVSELNASLVSLRGELGNVEAQESDYLARTADETRSANEATAKANEAAAAGDAQIETQLALQQILIEQARAKHEQMQKHAADAEALYNEGAVSRSDFEAAAAGRDDAKAALDAAVAQLDVISAGRVTPSQLKGVRTYTDYYASMKSSLTERIADVERQISEDYSGSMRKYYDTLIAGELAQIGAYEKSIADCSIASPVSGRIAKLYIKDSNAVNAASPIARIETGRSKDIEVFVSTKDFTDVRLGDSVEITQPASSGDMVFGGTVKAIADEAVSRVSALGIDERVVKITVAPDAPEAAALGASLIPGFSFDVKFFTFIAENKLTVPKTAIFKYTAEKAAPGIMWLGGDLAGSAVADVDMVFDASGGTVRMREVKPGHELRSDYVIDAGLEAGCTVVRDASADNVKPGARIKMPK